MKTRADFSIWVGEEPLPPQTHQPFGAQNDMLTIELAEDVDLVVTLAGIERLRGLLDHAEATLEDQ